MTEPLLYSAAPVFQIEGQRQFELARDAVRLEIEETTAGLATLSLRLIAQGPREGSDAETLLYLDGLLDFGQQIAVSLGPASAERTVFTGRISAIEAAFREGVEPEVLVFAEDRLMDLRMTRRTKTYENVTDAQIAEQIASEHGLSSEATADGPTYDRVQQWNQSDLAFLRDRARLIQAEISLSESTLRFLTRDQRSAAAITLVQGNELIALDVRADLAHQRTAVRVNGYDAGERAVIEEEAGEDAIQTEISGGRSGPAVLQRAFGERVSRRVRENPLVADEAAAWARAEMLRRARGFVQAVGVTNGTPDMTVGSRLTLERVGTPFSGGDYYVTRVRHTYDADEGHRTHFEAERATVQEGG